MASITLAQILSGFETYNISAAVTTMTAIAQAEDLTPDEARQYMLETLAREFPSASAQVITEALDATLQAQNAALQLAEGNDLSLGNIPLAAGICAGSPGQASCRYVVTVHLCTYQDDGTERWETVVIDTDEIPDASSIDSQLREMVRTGEGLSYPSGRTGQGTVSGALCGYQIISVFRSY